MRRVLLALVPLLLAPLAGCLTPPEAADAAAAALQADAASARNATVEDWYALDATAGPEAPLVGFWWTVPKGAVVPVEWWDDGGKPVMTTVLEVALLGAEGEEPALRELALVAFEKQDGALRPVSEAVFATYSVRAGGGEADVEEPDVAPFFMHLGLDDLEEGDAVGFALAARADATTPFRLAFRALPKEPYGADEEPAGDAEEFLKARAGRAPLPLAAAGAGDGFQLALYLELGGLFMLGSMEIWTDAVHREGAIDPDLRPVAARREETFSADFAGPGYSSAFGYYAAANAVGEWAAKADLHGETVDAGGPLVRTAAFDPWFLTGFPIYAAVGEGETGAASALTLDVTTASLPWEALVFVQLDLGETLDALLGETGETGSFAAEGILARNALTARADDLLLLSKDGPTRVFPGILPR